MKPIKIDKNLLIQIKEAKRDFDVADAFIINLLISFITVIGGAFVLSALTFEIIPILAGTVALASLITYIEKEVFAIRKEEAQAFLHKLVVMYLRKENPSIDEKALRNSVVLLKEQRFYKGVISSTVQKTNYIGLNGIKDIMLRETIVKKDGEETRTVVLIPETAMPSKKLVKMKRY